MTPMPTGLTEVDDGKVLQLALHSIQRLIHDHALRVPIVAEPNADHSVFLYFDGLVDVPP